MNPNSNDLLDLVMARQKEYLIEAEKTRLLKEARKQREGGGGRGIRLQAWIGRLLTSLGTSLEQGSGITQAPYAVTKSGDCPEAK